MTRGTGGALKSGLMDRQLRLFEVTADRRTGTWLEAPQEIGLVRYAEHFSKRDDVYYDVFEQGDETCAVVVR